MQTCGEHALTCFHQGYKCAESVVISIAADLGMENELIPQIASGFCSGMARTGGLCGAVAGGVLSLSLAFGRQSAEQSVDQLYRAETAFLNQFVTRYGATSCWDLIECDFNTEEGKAAYHARQLNEKCDQYVQDAADLVHEIIQAEKHLAAA